MSRPPRRNAPGAGRPDKGYVILRQTTMPPAAHAAIMAAVAQSGLTIGETIATRFGWSPAPPSKSDH